MALLIGEVVELIQEPLLVFKQLLVPQLLRVWLSKPNQLPFSKHL
jgi:hypothetical protein